MKTGELRPIRGQLIEVGGGDFTAKCADIGIAQIVRHDDEEVGPLCFLSSGRAGEGP